MKRYTKTQAEIIVRNPKAYAVEEVRAAACWMLGYLALTDEQIELASLACTYGHPCEVETLAAITKQLGR